MSTGLIAEITQDPKLVKIMERIEDTKFEIPAYEEELRMLIKLEGTLVMKITGPENYQYLISMLSKTQSFRERVVEIKKHLVSLENLWEKVQRLAIRHINLNYFDRVEELREGTKKMLFSSSLLPIEEGLSQVKNLKEQTELALKHLDTTLWNIKEESGMIKEYFDLLKNIGRTI
jgi:enamine deaminase RidA (YjgF/YER057c/UK114 family)